ncbi:hypothetical protein FNV43_RR04657 [Rhamnella rubrinervis]|uniref:Uncharacterized protein n=1 Tax=Rhamnella rubrinervis TaxID=2594499 RepID=A0A8K0HKQ3_9ROSA|nr:hypothetical protein FNV43_RR04657 [Rhamnella rubrinervis]
MDLNDSFKLVTRSLLPARSKQKQDICKAFSSFSTTEQEYLHQLFIQVTNFLMNPKSVIASFGGLQKTPFDGLL